LVKSQIPTSLEFDPSLSSHLRPFDLSEGLIYFMFYAFVLENPRGRLYIVHTDDLERRLKQHNSYKGRACRNLVFAIIFAFFNC
jgi:hypothetical protein